MIMMLPDINEPVLESFAFLIPLIAAAVGSAISTGGAIVAGTNKTMAQAKSGSSIDANQAEDLLKQNRNNFLAIASKTKSTQLLALDYFNQVWNLFISSMEKYGSVGQKSVDERKRGGVNSWGPDWFMLYYDPIANAQVYDDTVPVQTTVATVTSNGTVTTGGVPTSVVNTDVAGVLQSPMLIIGIAALAYGLMSNGKKGRR